MHVTSYQKISNSKTCTNQVRTDTWKHRIQPQGAETAQSRNRHWGEKFTPGWPL